MVAGVDPRSGFQDVYPRRLFDAPDTAPAFDVSADGQRFVLLRLEELPVRVPHVIVNWFERLRALAPAE